MNQAGAVTAGQLSMILNISEYAVTKLANKGQLPFVSGPRKERLFQVENVFEYFRLLEQAGRSDALLTEQQQRKYLQYRAVLAKECPQTMRALEAIRLDEREPRKCKGYNLVKVPNKRHGFIYYVRYWDGGRMLPTKFNTHTNDQGEAERYARENRDALIKRYVENHDAAEFRVFEEFYTPGTEYYNTEALRNNMPALHTVKDYRYKVQNNFIPFLREQKVTSIKQITVYVLRDYQDRLLGKGLKPQSVNNYVKPLGKIFEYLERKGKIKENPYLLLRGIMVLEDDAEGRGCYDVSQLKGVFRQAWDDDLSYLLNLVAYSTGMRNSEIARLRLEDIRTIDDCRFVEVKESKTKNGLRLVPLHPFVYERLAACAVGKMPCEPIFGDLHWAKYSKAALALGVKIYGKGAEEKLTAERITFYSGRHFYKTMLNGDELGEGIEEILMGHKVREGVAKRYNHRDKQGKRLFLKKAREVYSILDRRLFASTGRGGQTRQA